MVKVRVKSMGKMQYQKSSGKNPYLMPYTQNSDGLWAKSKFKNVYESMCVYNKGVKHFYNF